jgi:hypothetical protein
LEDEKDEFTLVLPTMHEIMSVNKDPNHVAHKISKYFEMHRSKKAILHLIKPDQTREEVLEVQEFEA